MIHAVIVEDDPMVAQINQQYLELSGIFRADRVFGNGRDALEYLRSSKVDLVILDVYMPSPNGIELLHQMRTEHIYTAVIMVTAAAEMHTIDEALKLGIIDYLIKPYSFERFQEALKKFLAIKELEGKNPTADQSVVDLILSSNPGMEAEQQILRKGLTEKTLKSITDYLHRHRGERYSCESLSQTFNLSKVTIRRYLNYLIEIGEVTSSIDYKTGGRPGVLYHLKL